MYSVCKKPVTHKKSLNVTSKTGWLLISSTGFTLKQMISHSSLGSTQSLTNKCAQEASAESKINTCEQIIQNINYLPFNTTSTVSIWSRSPLPRPWSFKMLWTVVSYQGIKKKTRKIILTNYFWQQWNRQFLHVIYLSTVTFFSTICSTALIKDKSWNKYEYATCLLFSHDDLQLQWMTDMHIDDGFNCTLHHLLLFQSTKYASTCSN